MDGVDPMELDPFRLLVDDIPCEITPIVGDGDMIYMAIIQEKVVYFLSNPLGLLADSPEDKLYIKVAEAIEQHYL